VAPFVPRLKNLFHTSVLLLVIPLACSAFTYLWNPIGFPYLAYDEGTYIGRAMNVLIGQGFEDYSILYDHPYFGQLFLAGIFWMIGYPVSLHPTAYGDVVHSVEMLWLVPRVLMGVLAVIDTFLVYKISERVYNNKTVAFIASVLFAVMPPNWFLRQPYLDAILMPFLLSSILFATFYTRNSYSSEYDKKNNTMMNKNRNIISVLLSGMFLGLAIFTKIPAFTMIPLVGFLIYKNNKSVKTLGLWFIPVILIPLIWPAYAMYLGQFNLWLDGIYYQTHRENKPLIDSLSKFFKLGPVLVGLGMIGLAFAVLKRDLFLLLWVGPFLVFLYLVGLVRDFHLILIFPTFCIAAAKLILDLSNKVRTKKFQQVLPFVIISGIGIFGLVSTVMLITTTVTSHYFEAVAFVAHYLKQETSSIDSKKNDQYDSDINNNDIRKYTGTVDSDKNNTITVVSSHVYSWIPRYVFQITDDYKEPYDEISLKSQKFLLVLDNSFNYPMSENDETGARLRKIYNLSNTNPTSSLIQGGPHKNSLDLIIPKPLPNSGPRDHLNNMIDQNHIWKPWNYAKITQNDSKLILYVNTTNTSKIFNRAVLQTELNLAETPLLLSLDYASKSYVGNATFYVEIKDKNAGGKTLWDRSLRNTSGNLTNEMFILPSDIANKPVGIRLNIVTQGAGEHSLAIKNMSIT
jgi:Dolichyl-phosphate-mannose-protein mannosyltransferase